MSSIWVIGAYQTDDDGDEHGPTLWDDYPAFRSEDAVRQYMHDHKFLTRTQQKEVVAHERAMKLNKNIRDWEEASKRFEAAKAKGVDPRALKDPGLKPSNAYVYLPDSWYEPIEIELHE